MSTEQVKKFNADEAAERAIIEAPDYTDGSEGFNVIEAPCTEVVEHAPQHETNSFEHVGSEDALRHGRVFAKGLGVAFKASTKEKLDDDVKDTLSEQMGFVFGALSRLPHGRLIVGVFMGISILPVVGVIGLKMWEGIKDIKEDIE